jgi:hypothetical protein
MRIWKLIPTNLADPIWKLWSPEPIIVRAETEAEARLLAQLKTAKLSSAKRGQEITLNGAGIRRWKIPRRRRFCART